MNEDFKEQLKEYLSEHLALVIGSHSYGGKEEVVKVDILLEGEKIAGDSFTIWQN